MYVYVYVVSFHIRESLLTQDDIGPVSYIQVSFTCIGLFSYIQVCFHIHKSLLTQDDILLFSYL